MISNELKIMSMYLVFRREQQCLVSSVDLVYRNSWTSLTLHFSGETAIIDALKLSNKMHQDALPPESVDVFCHNENLRGVMRNMVYQRPGSYRVTLSPGRK